MLTIILIFTAAILVVLDFRECIDDFKKAMKADKFGWQSRDPEWIALRKRWLEHTGLDVEDYLLAQACR